MCERRGQDECPWRTGNCEENGRGGQPKRKREKRGSRKLRETGEAEERWIVSFRFPWIRIRRWKSESESEVRVRLHPARRARSLPCRRGAFILWQNYSERKIIQSPAVYSLGQHPCSTRVRSGDRSASPVDAIRRTTIRSRKSFAFGPAALEIFLNRPSTKKKTSSFRISRAGVENIFRDRLPDIITLFEMTKCARAHSSVRFRERRVDELVPRNRINATRDKTSKVTPLDSRRTRYSHFRTAIFIIFRVRM